MATTSPDNIKTPDSGDQYALVQDLGALADTVQSALSRRARIAHGTDSVTVSTTLATRTVSFPPGTFTAAPGVSVMNNSPSSLGSSVVWRVTAISSAQFTVEVTRMAGSSASWSFRWQAVGT